MSQAGSIGSGSGPTPPIIISGYRAITFADSPYTVIPTDYYISADTAGGEIVIIFPFAPTQNTTYIIKDRTGHASVNNIDVQAFGATTIDLSDDYFIAGNFGSIQLLYHSGNYEIF